MFEETDLNVFVYAFNTDSVASNNMSYKSFKI